MHTTELLPWIDLSSPSGFEDCIGQLTRQGAALVSGIDSRESMMRFGRHIGRILPHPHAGPDGVTEIQPASESGIDSHRFGFTSEEMPPHTDRTIDDQPPHLIMTVCEVPADNGGEVTLVDGKRVFELLAQRDDDAIDRLALSQSVVFRRGSSFVARSVFTYDLLDRVIMRFGYDSICYFNADVLPALGPLLDCIRGVTLTVPVARGCGYIVQNGRWLHGRKAFSGYRRMLRLGVLLEDEYETSIGFGFQGSLARGVV